MTQIAQGVELQDYGLELTTRAVSTLFSVSMIAIHLPKGEIVLGCMWLSLTWQAREGNKAHECIWWCCFLVIFFFFPLVLWAKLKEREKRRGRKKKKKKELLLWRNRIMVSWEQWDADSVPGQNSEFRIHCGHSYSSGHNFRVAKKEINKQKKTTNPALQELSLQADLCHLENMSLQHTLCMWVIGGFWVCQWAPEGWRKEEPLSSGQRALAFLRGEVCRLLAELFPWHCPKPEDNLGRHSQSGPVSVNVKKKLVQLTVQQVKMVSLLPGFFDYTYMNCEPPRRETLNAVLPRLPGKWSLLM